jgi:hypothetical protein
MNRRGQRPQGRVGRPPAGARAGEKVKDYPQLSVRVPPDVKRTIEVLVQVTARPQWRVIAGAVAGYVRDLPPADRRVVEKLLRQPRTVRTP